MPHKLQAVAQFLRTIPKKRYLYALIGLAAVLYVLNYLLPKQVAFTYGAQTCHPHLTMLPGLQRVDDAAYEVSFGDTLRVGPLPIASFSTCFATKNAPEAGASIVGVAPFGGPFARTLYRINVPKAPVPRLMSIKPEIPVSKSLRIAMSGHDSLYQYELRVADKTARCTMAASILDCDVPSLGLAQGQVFDYTVKRSFRGGAAQPIGTGTFKTLRAVTVTQGTVSNGQVVYARPTELTFTTDKPIAAATVRLTSDGKPVELSQKIESSTLTLALRAELPRVAIFELLIESIEAKDGSTLVEPYKAVFRTSGGPKVSSVSVGASSVGQSSAIIVTFDQPLSKTKDVLPHVRFTGGQATVQKRSDTQLLVRLNAMPLCQPFTITVNKDMPSEHDLPAGADWNFTSRTVCYQTMTYGTSLKGRALTAYSFGTDGPVTMYVGGIHGSEPSSTTLMRAWLAELESNPGRLVNKRVVIIPAINPDGLAANIRTNSRGVNLNRNFPTDNWVKSIRDTDGTNPSGGGESPLSEPEAAALAKITTNYRPRLLLSFHAVGSLAIGDPGGYSAAYAARYASMVGYRDGTSTSSSNFDYNVTGGYEDWTYRNLGIPSIVVELSSYTGVNAAGHFGALWVMLE